MLTTNSTSFINFLFVSQQSPEGRIAVCDIADIIDLGTQVPLWVVELSYLLIPGNKWNKLLRFNKYIDSRCRKRNAGWVDIDTNVSGVV